MTVKGNAAASQLFHLLEARYAVRVILALSDGHSQTFRILQDSVGGASPPTLNTRIKELRTALLVEHDGHGYRLTNLGAELAHRLADVQQFAGKWGKQKARVSDGQAPPAGT